MMKFHISELETFFVNDDERRDGARQLVTSGCCPRCVLRFLGDKQTTLFMQTDQEISSLVTELCGEDDQEKTQDKVVRIEEDNEDNKAVEIDEDGQDNKVMPIGEGVQNNEENTAAQNCFMKTGGGCVGCLGILQNFCNQDAIDSIVSNIRASDYEFASFICSVSEPVSTIIRKHSLWIYMKEAFPETFGSRCKSDVPDVKDVWKWRCGPMLSDTLGVPFDPKSNFSIGIVFVHEKSDSECNQLRTGLQGDKFMKRKSKNPVANNPYTRTAIIKVLDEATDGTFKRCVETPPSKPTCTVKSLPTHCEHDSVYVAGRYNKYSRKLSQTPWFIEGVRKSESSVEELIAAEILKKFRPKDQKFASSGREDVDVRMLGRGRPFVLELIDPHRVNFTQTELTTIQCATNENTEMIKVRDLQIVSKEDTGVLKIGEESKVKVYSAKCWSLKVLNAIDLECLSQLKDIKIQQKTPIRVLHRRNLSTREKTIHSLSGEIIDDHQFRLRLSTQAGTYIKEFVHSDFGRTSPSLGDYLNTECDILELDVDEVEIDWPKKIVNEDEDKN